MTLLKNNSFTPAFLRKRDRRLVPSSDSLLLAVNKCLLTVTVYTVKAISAMDIDCKSTVFMCIHNKHLFMKEKSIHKKDSNEPDKCSVNCQTEIVPIMNGSISVKRLLSTLRNRYTVLIELIVILYIPFAYMLYKDRNLLLILYRPAQKYNTTTRTTVRKG